MNNTISFQSLKIKVQRITSQKYNVLLKNQNYFLIDVYKNTLATILKKQRWRQ